MAKLSAIEKFAKKHGAKIETIKPQAFGAAPKDYDGHKKAWVVFMGNVSRYNGRLLSCLRDVDEDMLVAERVKKAKKKVDKQGGNVTADEMAVCKWNNSKLCFVIKLAKGNEKILIGGKTHLYIDGEDTIEKGLEASIVMIDGIADLMDDDDMEAEIRKWMSDKTATADKALVKKIADESKAMEAGMGLSEFRLHRRDKEAADKRGMTIEAYRAQKAKK